MSALFFVAWACAFLGAFWNRLGAPWLYDNQWFWMAVLGALLAAKVILVRKFGLAAAGLFVLAVANAAWFWLWRGNMYEFVHPYDKMGLQFFIADGIAKLCLVVMPIAVAMENRDQAKEYGGLLASAVVVGNCALVIHQFFSTGKHCSIENTCGGFLGNPSINDTVMVAMLPFALHYLVKPLNWCTALAVGLCVVVSQSRVGVGLLVALFLLEAIYRRRWAFLSIIPLIAIPAKIFVRKDFGGTGDRAQMWDFFARLMVAHPGYHFGTWKDWWRLGKRTHLPHFIFERLHGPNGLHRNIHWKLLPTGSGYGSFGLFSRNLQGFFKNHTQHWWAFGHNDWFEGFFFDLGLSGLFMGVLVYFLSLAGFIRRGEKTEAQALIIFGMGMGMNYPLHLAMPCAFVTWLVLLGLMRRREEAHGFRLLWSNSPKLANPLGFAQNEVDVTEPPQI